MKTDLDMTLYLVTDSTYHTEETFYKTIEEACQGGVTLVQLREKNCGGREYLEKAMKVKAITDRYQIPLIIDARVDVAIACDAAGVHVGSSDLPGQENYLGRTRSWALRQRPWKRRKRRMRTVRITWVRERFSRQQQR